MTVLITLTTAGSDTGPFNLYSDADGFLSAFETGVSKASLLAGYPSSLVPDTATTVRIMSDNSLCTNYVDVYLFVPFERCTINDSSNPNPYNEIGFYFAMERDWSEASYPFTLNSMLLNGVEYGTGQVITIIPPGDLITGVGLDGRIYVMNLSDWLTSIAPAGWVFHDDMNTVDHPVGHTFEIAITGGVGGIDYYYTNDGFAYSDPDVIAGNYVCTTITQ